MKKLISVLFVLLPVNSFEQYKEGFENYAFFSNTSRTVHCMLQIRNALYCTAGPLREVAEKPALVVIVKQHPENINRH